MLRDKWIAVQLKMRDHCAEIAGRSNIYGEIGPVIAERIKQLKAEPLPEFDPEEFPPHTRHRRSDPDTSRDAAHSIEDIRESQRHVLAVVKENGPISDGDLHVVLELNETPMSTSGARTRRSELVEMGFVEDSGERALTISGRDTILWRATDVQEK